MAEKAPGELEEDYEDEDEEDDDFDEEEQFSEYNCPHCGKPIHIIVVPGADDEEII